jgi:hypothetical protein
VAEPTIAETARLLRRLNAAGTVRRLDQLHAALCSAYNVGRRDETQTRAGVPEAESCLEG